MYAKPLPKTRIELGAYYSNKDYPRAFAFNNPLQKDKAKDIVSLYGSVEFEIARHWMLVGSLSYRDERTPDARFRYDRTIASLGLAFDF